MMEDLSLACVTLAFDLALPWQLEAAPLCLPCRHSVADDQLEIGRFRGRLWPSDGRSGAANCSYSPKRYSQARGAVGTLRQQPVWSTPVLERGFSNCEQRPLTQAVPGSFTSREEAAPARRRCAGPPPPRGGRPGRRA